MEKLFVQLSIIVSLTLMLTACPGEVGPPLDEEVPPLFNTPLGGGLYIQDELVNTVLGRVELEPTDSKSTILFSYSPPATGIAVGDLIPLASSTDSEIAFLNTVYEEGEKPKVDITLLVNDDTVRKFDHSKSTIIVQQAFHKNVCEIIPVEKVLSQNIGGETTYTIVDADYVYVVTSEGETTDDECFIADNKKQYFKLPMSHKSNADILDETHTIELELVPESLAKAELVFGWVDDEESGESQLKYGYLGYGHDEHLLVMYGPSNELDDVLWSQERNIQEFTVYTHSDGQVTPEYLFELTELENYHYVLQLGLDLFVFNAGIELFSKVTDENNHNDAILSDRSFKMAAKIIESGTTSIEYISSVLTRYDDDELIIVDGSRIFKLDYLNDFTLPTNVSDYTVRKPRLNASHGEQLSGYRPFSQFDLKPCTSYKIVEGEDEDEDGESVDPADFDNCVTTHNLKASTWQFITDCETELGCPTAEVINDNCITVDQNRETPTPSLPSPDHQEICTPSEFTHLSELDQPDNNAQFRGFMQYDKKFIDELDFILDNNSLFITARMNEKDVLLRYFYQEDLTAPKSDREAVLFGDRIDHFGLDVYLEHNNLFVTSLLKSSIRSHECYKNYQLVSCNNVCTEEDIAKRICFNEFQEFSSVALFCSASELSSGICSDTQIAPNNLLSVEDSTHDAKWIALLDETFDETLGVSGNREMYLLSGAESSVKDEGVLVDAELLSINNITGVINKVVGPFSSSLVNDVIGTVSGDLKSTIGGWIEKDADEALGFGHFLTIPEEVYQTADAIATQSSVIQNFIVEDGAGTKIQNKADIASRLKEVTDALDEAKEGPINMMYFFDRPVTTK